MAEELLKLHIVTPDREIFSETVERIVFKSTEGDMAVLYDHIPLTAILTSGIAKIIQKGETIPIVLHEGFAEITEESITILAEAAEWPHEIDIERARQAMVRAESVLHEQHYHYRDATHTRVHNSLLRALTRIEAYEFHNKEDDDI